MCGLIAYLAFDPKSRITAPQIDALNAMLYHRGPDSSGYYQQDDVALAMRRLSIMDLQEGNQPMATEDGRFVIVYNGEIYNYEQLRADLAAKGYRFKTQSDTEVLLNAFVDQGENCLSALNGMFAFAIWDRKLKQLFLARDRLGIKPLYYAINAHGAMFCSELTPIYRSKLFDLKFNYRSLSDYLSYWYICEPNTIFENIFQLAPGSYMFVRNGKTTSHKYWHMPNSEELEISFPEATRRLEELLHDAVQLQMKGDVPVGTFLSGGIDSGLVTKIASQYTQNPLKSFSIGFKEKSYCELEAAKESAKACGVDLHTVQIPPLTPHVLQKIFSAFDEPLGNASFVPMYFLAEKASEFLKVVLTGDGGDELFGGYPTYQAPYYQSIGKKIPSFLLNLVRSGIQKLPVSHSRISLDYRLKQLMQGMHLSYDRAHFTWRQIAPLELQHRLFHGDVLQQLEGHDPFSIMEEHFNKAHKLSVKNQLMYVDMNTYLLNDHLRKVDRMTMAHSLEARVPYLDHRLVEFGMRLPERYKTTFFETKKILKHIAGNYLPKRIIHGRKKGLTVPIANWISIDLKEYIRDSLHSGMIANFFKQSEVEAVLEQHYRKEKDNSRIIWSLLTLHGWSKNLQ